MHNSPQKMHPVELIKAKRAHLARLANQSGAAGETSAIERMEDWFPRPTGPGLKILIQSLNEEGIFIKPSSFDAIYLPEIKDLDFTNKSEVSMQIKNMTFIEIKTSNQKRVKPNFSGFFFAITESEIMASDALGDQHKVALYNKITEKLMLTSIPELLARAKSTNWQLSLQL